MGRGQDFDEQAMLNNGQCMVDSTPVCQLEASAHKIKAPGKSLNSIVGDKASLQSILP